MRIPIPVLIDSHIAASAGQRVEYTVTRESRYSAAAAEAVNLFAAGEGRDTGRPKPKILVRKELGGHSFSGHAPKGASESPWAG